MRKIKNKEVEKFNKQMKKVKPTIIQSENDENITMISLSIFNINRALSRLFQFEKQVKMVRTSNVCKLEFKNSVICSDSFENEFKLFKKFLEIIYNVDNPLTEEKLIERLKYIKNPKANKAYSKSLDIYSVLITTFMKPYLIYISDKYMLRTNLEYISLLSQFYILKDYLNHTKNEVLLDLYDKKFLRNLRTVTTKIFNRIPYCLKELTGRETVDEFKFKALLETMMPA